MLWSGPNRKLTQIPAAANKFAWSGPTRGPESEQRLKRGHRSLAPVVAEDEFVEIDLQLMAPTPW